MQFEHIPTQQNATRVRTVVTRDDGRQVALVMERWPNVFLEKGYEVHRYALQRAAETEPWCSVSDLKAPNWKQMSREQYLREGRSELDGLTSFAQWAKLLRFAKTLWNHGYQTKT